MTKTILIIDDDITFSTILRTWLSKKGFIVSTVGSMTNAHKELEKEKFDLILSDLRLPDEDGISLLTWMAQKEVDIPVIIMTGYAEIGSAVQAMKCGARDYIAKPIHPDELLKKIEEVLIPANKEKNKTEKEDVNSGKNNDFLEGKSEAAQQLYNYVALVAPTPMSVLINGASGTGKEYVAHRIHQLSRRSREAFIAIDCGSIPKELAASEFFGHIKGSFTGAISDKTGAFVEANGGTLFLDEVGNLGYEIQIQLLRALQERRIRPIGSTKEIQVDVRLICATNENLSTAIERGSFREDLFHRINEFTLQMPSLKERREDIMLFANFFLDKANKELDKQLIGFDQAATEILQHYSWPGNLRQMKNIIKRATLLSQGKLITPNELPQEIREENREPHSSSLTLYNENEEKSRITDALKRCGNNKSKAAELLGIDRKTLYNKLKLYNL